MLIVIGFQTFGFTLMLEMSQRCHQRARPAVSEEGARPSRMDRGGHLG